MDRFLPRRQHAVHLIRAVLGCQIQFRGVKHAGADFGFACFTHYMFTLLRIPFQTHDIVKPTYKVWIEMAIIESKMIVFIWT